MRRAAEAAVVALLLALSAVVQLSVLPWLHLPAATPALVLVVAAVVGCARGPSVGAGAGFSGGLLLDLAPPSHHPVGQWAVVLTVVGYLAGRCGAGPLTSRTVRVGLVAVLAAGGTLSYVALSAAWGAGWPPSERLTLLVAAAGGYAIVLAVPLLSAADLALGRASPVAKRW